MSRKANEQLLNLIGEIDEKYVLEYMEAKGRKRRPGRRRLRLTLALAAALTTLFGTAALASAVPSIGHLLADRAHAEQAAMQNFDQIEAAYGTPVGGAQECHGVTGVLNSATVEDHFLLLCYTFDWRGLEEAQDGSFHTWFLPWFFYITADGSPICGSEYTDGLHTQTYPGQTTDDFSETIVYCIDLDDMEGTDLVGKELTVSLLYSEEGEGFTDTFTPEACFSDRIWPLDKIYEFGEHRIELERLQESALYVTLFLDCDTIGHTEDEYTFMLSDELGNNYPAYPYGDRDTDGYWFVKPETVGSQLTLKVVRGGLQTDNVGHVTDDSYETLCEIPIEPKLSFWDRILGAF